MHATIVYNSLDHENGSKQVNLMASLTLDVGFGGWEKIGWEPRWTWQHECQDGHAML